MLSNQLVAPALECGQLHRSQACVVEASQRF